VPVLPAINRKPEIVAAIHAALERERAKQPERGLRLSEIGGCERYLWAVHNRGESVQRPTAEALAIFDMGHAVEELAVRWLELAGFEVFDRQDAVCMPVHHDKFCDDGCVPGHIDGVVRIGESVLLLEVKSAKASRFAELEKVGYREWDSGYYDQVQANMGASGTEAALVFVVCKDTSAIYTEKIRFDADHYEALRAKARRILTAEAAPERPYKSQYGAPCKWCPLAEACWSPAWEVKFDE
jgi:hypothetical protein